MSSSSNEKQTSKPYFNGERLAADRSLLTVSITYLFQLTAFKDNSPSFLL